jgi:uncharacterized membrane protein YjdF
MKEQKIPAWEKNSKIILGIIILVSGIYQTFFGELAIGLLTLLSLAVITIPGFFTKNFIKKFPIEIEILLFIMVMLQFVLGEARDFYTNVPYYDKIVHYMIPMFLGIIGFLVLYTLHMTGKLQTSITVMMILITLITLGIGAAWEILEYASDVLIAPRIPGWHHFQGNAQQDALTDTMTDLIYDTLGAVFGSLLGLWLLGKKIGTRRRSLINEIDNMMYKNQKAAKTNSTNQFRG